MFHKHALRRALSSHSNTQYKITLTVLFSISLVGVTHEVRCANETQRLKSSEDRHSRHGK